MYAIDKYTTHHGRTVWYVTEYGHAVYEARDRQEAIEQRDVFLAAAKRAGRE